MRLTAMLERGFHLCSRRLHIHLYPYCLFPFNFPPGRFAWCCYDRNKSLCYLTLSAVYMDERLCNERIASACLVAISRMLCCNDRLLGEPVGQAGFIRVQAFSSCNADPYG